MTPPPSGSFVRDRFTWLAYLMLAYYAYLQAGLGPVMPFLREEMTLSYTVAGLHFSAFAAGMIASGLFADSLRVRLGRRRFFWYGAAGMGAGAVALALGERVAVTIGAIALMGTAGSMLLIMIQAALSDLHGAQRAIAFTESNVLASLGAVLAPLVVGGLQAVGISWRAAILVIVFVAALFGLFSRRVILPGAHGQSSSSTQQPDPDRLPGAYWAYWLVLFLAVAAEWTLVFWGAEFLENSFGLAKSLAASLLSIFFLAMLSGRLTGSFLTRRWDTRRLLTGSLLVSLTGFLLFWLAGAASLSVAGLFLAGLGVANLYPLTLAAATAEAPALADKASARATLGAGLAIFSAPFALGYVADRIGIQSAFSATGVLLLLALLVTWLVRSSPTSGALGRA